jgi:hypothetical protein
MTQLDKLILLLHHGALTTDDLCLQLGKDWDDIKETIGLMSIRGWIVSTFPKISEGHHGPRTFMLTPHGKEEFDRRVKEASK